ncbi:STAS domain-containing protein [Anaerobacillus alkaliphilus]|uniref:STAS domain-containing protein n=1 Tax=Anaerobacillus alkaliphilus TaxID=1548597 RepID=A0A4Q0VVD8_9BACI|nr:STAS domain-containing protein [Anaerobacillus alkaliphilus]RXJ01951.1 STAS domain-containing protein [Anaerobacillus alkaliphilus]
MKPSVVKLIEAKRETIFENWLREIEIVKREDLDNISDYVYTNTNKEFVEIILTSISHGQELFDDHFSQFTEGLIQVGWPLSYLTTGLQTFRKVVLDTLYDGEETSSVNMEVYSEVSIWVDKLVNILVNEYAGSWENTVFLQKMALKELSAPLIPVFENISVMPLIGTIDTERAKLVMENLLNGVIEHRSEVVLIDITGVPVVDTMVANHIIQASEAVRLVGAKCILVGIRPEIAQTIVNLGIDLSSFPTKNTLKKGIETALEITNKKIVPVTGVE